MKKFLLLVLALLGAPLTYALGRALLQAIATLLNSTSFGTSTQLAFIGGAIAMVALYFWRGKKLMITYVFAHELTHAIAALLCFAKISKFQVSSSGGSVSVSKNNLFITLAPYCFPLYLLFAVGLFCLFPQGPVIWNAIFGVFAAFHVLYTLDAIFSVAQPDFRCYGFIFSYWWVFTFNLLFAFIALIVTQDFALGAEFRELFRIIGDTYQSLWGLL